MARTTVVFCIGLPHLVAGYPALGPYMPVSNVHEHAQMSLEVKAFSDALTGSSPDYSLAKSIYQLGNGASCKSSSQTRTLQGFAQKDVTGETFADAFIAGGKTATFWDPWFLAALDGTGDFAGLSNTKRRTSLQKGAMGLVTWYAAHELDSAINKGVANQRADTQAAHAWDEGWAFYFGAENDGSGMPYEVAKTRDNDFPSGTKIADDIAPHFNKGLRAVRESTYDATTVKEAEGTIYTMWSVTYLRAALKYLQISESTYQEKAHAEGYAYYMAIDGWVASKGTTGKEAADAMRAALAITQTSIPSGTFCAAKGKLEQAYPALGLSCEVMGSYVGQGSMSCSTPCSSSPVTFPAGANAVSAVTGTATDVTCVATYPALGSYMPVSNVHEHAQMSLEVQALSDALTGSSPDYSLAKSIYQSGNGSSCKTASTARTLQGFAQKDMAGETFADAFVAGGKTVTFWDPWFLSALDGSGVFAGLSDTKRRTSLQKGAMGLMTWYASHELDSAINKGVANQRADTQAAHAWDEGWAFYYGAASDGSGMPYEVAKKRDNDFPSGTDIATDIAPQFNKGLRAVRQSSYNANTVKEAEGVIYKMWSVTYLRAALKYLQISESTYSEKAHAEGYAYYMAIDGWVASKGTTGKEAADMLRAALAITKTSIESGTYCAAKAKLEQAYPALGLSCDIMGSYVGSGSMSCSTACSSPTVNFPAGDNAVSAMPGTASDVTCYPSPATNDNKDASNGIRNYAGFSAMAAFAMAIAAVAIDAVQ